MNPPAPPRNPGVGFRTKLTLAMMLVVSGVLAVALLFARQKIADDAQRDFERDFAAEIDALAAVREVRHAALAERCRALVRKPRLHAALEDNALDLLYPSARDELRDIIAAEAEPTAGSPRLGLQARWYRFLDAAGRVIPGAPAEEAGRLNAADEARLALPAAPELAQSGYLRRTTGAGEETLDELLVMPVRSSETNEPIAALVLAFQPTDLQRRRSGALQPGVWLDGRLHLPALAADARTPLSTSLALALSAGLTTEANFPVAIGGAPHRLFYRLLNPGSALPPAYEVCLYPLDGLVARQRRLGWQLCGVGVLLVAAGWAASNFFSLRLARPVEKLATESEHDRAQRVEAEAHLAVKQEELRRAARFSADASHQLKTPVTVLRAGLEELLAAERLSGEQRDEVTALVRQTLRLTAVIEDLLLLSRMDAGRLQLAFAPVDLSPLLAGWLDDLGAGPDPFGLEVESDFPPGLLVHGERRYTAMILQNLFDNARKYNRPGGRVRVVAAGDGTHVRVAVGNTGAAIPGEAQERIFDRFHRGGMGENVPGHGLGLNLARELARVHGGELRLVQSAGDWTEFEVRFRAAPAAAATGVRP